MIDQSPLTHPQAPLPSPDISYAAKAECVEPVQDPPFSHPLLILANSLLIDALAVLHFDLNTIGQCFEPRLQLLHRSEMHLTHISFRQNLRLILLAHSPHNA